MERILTSDVPAHAGETVSLSGWVHNLRSFREVVFLILRDRAGLVQTVIGPGAEIDRAALGKECCVRVVGEVRPDHRAPGGAEVHLESLEILSTAEPPPLEIDHPPKLKKTHIDKLLDHRSTSLRAPEIRAIFEVQSVLIEAFGAHLRSQGFSEIKTSKIVATGTEGGANVFEIDYFDTPAFLAQSPQFYKQIMVGSGLERVFEVGPVYRAEKHETSRHLSEYVSLDYEMGFIESEQDVIAMQVGVLRHMMDAVRERCAKQVELLGATVPVIGETIPQLTYDEAVALVEAQGHRSPAGDLDPEGERRLCEWAREEHGSEFLYVVGFPLAKRPMYTYFREDAPEISRSFDLLFRGLEITTGSQRIHDYALLVEKVRERGLDPEMFDYYLAAFRHGMPPHGGLAIGLERLTKQVLDLPNVKLATLFPRDRHRLTP